MTKLTYMNRYLMLLVAGMLSFMIQSCSDRTGEWLDRTPVFRIIAPEGSNEQKLDLDGREQNVVFTVLSTGPWSAEVSGCDDYILDVVSGGVGKHPVTLKVPANESGEIRNATLSFSSDTEMKSEFYITQIVQEPYLELSEESVFIYGEGGDFTVQVNTNQSDWKYTIETEGVDWIVESEKTSNSISFNVLENKTGEKRSAQILFDVPGKPELFDYLTIEQDKPALPPTDLILDVIFKEDGKAYDNSSLAVNVDNSRLNSDCSVKLVEKFDRYAAVFNNGTLARTNMTDGYYFIPYKLDTDFTRKIADGCSYELVFCTYYDPLTYTDGLKQVKPFASTQAGGLGVCLKANSGVIQLESHVGGSWKSPASSIVPVPNQYYHVVGIVDINAGVASIYVDGKFESSVNINGDFKFQETSSDARWFGIGADPNAKDLGEASFYGEVVVARLYDAPMSASEVKACYDKLFK